MQIVIKHRTEGTTLFSHGGQGNTIVATIEAALADSASLVGADLSRQDLRGLRAAGADFSGVDFSKCRLDSVDFSHTVCKEAVFTNAVACGGNFEQADLRKALLDMAEFLSCNLQKTVLRDSYCFKTSFHDSDLRGTTMADADLSHADLTATVLIGAYLGDTNLRLANLAPIRDDFYALLSGAPQSAELLISFLKAGTLAAYHMTATDSYGTLAKILMSNPVSTTAINFQKLPMRPAEIFAMSIAEGDLPGENQVLAILIDWADAWVKRMRAAYSNIRG